MRILCVAREGAYATLHEPPTADPHGGWCGGWELKTPGYPIRRHGLALTVLHVRALSYQENLRRRFVEKALYLSDQMHAILLDR